MEESALEMANRCEAYGNFVGRAFCEGCDAYFYQEELGTSVKMSSAWFADRFVLGAA